MRVVFVVPASGALFGGLLLFGALTTSTKTIDPASIKLYSQSDYERKAELYAEQGDKENALATCEDLEETGDYADICYLHTYLAFDDIDGEIRIYEKWLAKKKAAGDSTEHVENILKKLRQERR